MSSEPIDLGVAGLSGLERIGAGGNAIVYRARQAELDRNVVVKVLMAVDADSTRRRFDRERRAMGRLSQVAGIAPVYDSGFTVGGQPYLIMPFYERGSLQEWLESRGAFPADEVRDIGVRICRAVQVAHENGVVHRDLKPANILMSSSGRPDVADFGIAHILDDTSGASQALTMTPLYTAPEVFDGIDSGVATDIYSLGALLFALLNGRPAYGDETGRVPMLSLMRRINEDPLPGLPGSVSADLSGVVTKAMHKDPGHRYRSAAAMADALEAADVRKVERAKRPYGLLVAALSVLVAAITVALVVANLRTGRDSAVDEPRQTVVPTSESEPTPAPTPTPSLAAPNPFDREVALDAAGRATVRVEAFSCTGVSVADGVLLNDGLVVTSDKILRSPWFISVIDVTGSHPADALTSDRTRALAMIQVADSSELNPPLLTAVEDGTRVGVVSDNNVLHEVDLVIPEPGAAPRLLLSPDDARAIESGDVVVTDAGTVVGIASVAAPDVAVLTIDRIEQDWMRTPPLFGCPSLSRDLGVDDVGLVESREIEELLVMQRLSNAYAAEEWDLVRLLEPGKQSLSDQNFVDGWRPLRQGFIYPVERDVTGDGSGRWRIGLIGHETWFGSDLTTLFCVTWSVDPQTSAVTQTDENTVAVYGSQPTQPRRDGFVDPGDLRVLITQNCRLAS